MKKAAYFALLLALFSGLLFGCSKLAQTVSKRPNIVFILIDTLRADRLGAYGSEKGLTPFIDSIAKQSVVFTQCFAPSSYTVPSVASIYTGLYPSNHGVEFGLVRKEANSIVQHKLSNKYPTLPKILKNHGYATHGFVTNACLKPEFGFSGGFDHYDVKSWEEGIWITKQLNTNLARINAQKPYFLFFLYFDPHETYNRHRRLDLKFPEGFPDEKISDFSQSYLSDLEGKEDIKTGTQQLQVLETLYDGEVLYTDQHLQNAFKKLNITDDDLVVITSDHGEGFMEHGRLGHAVHLYNETLHVPLIIRLPKKRFAGQRIDAIVSLVDLLPTVCQMAGIMPKGNYDGLDLLNCLNTKVFTERPLFANLNRSKEINFSATFFRDWKFIIDRSNKKMELFNLRLDPSETKNLKEEYPNIAKRMEKLIQDHVKPGPRRKPVMARATEITKEELEKFKAMGYLNN